MSRKESLLYMLSAFLIAFLLMGVWGMTFAQQVTGEMIPVSVEISEVPEDIDSFVEMRNEIAVTPQGGATMYILALMIYSEDYETGLKCATASLVNDPSLLRSTVPFGYEGLEPLSEIQNRFTILQRKPWIVKSYAVEAKPENNYSIEDDFKIKFYISDQSVGGNDNIVELKVLTSGDDDFRTVTVEKNQNDIWKVWGWDMIIADVAVPNGPRKDNL